MPLCIFLIAKALWQMNSYDVSSVHPISVYGRLDVCYSVLQTFINYHRNNLVKFEKNVNEYMINKISLQTL